VLDDSAAERSATGERRGLFDANDLLALARAFELPIGWFLPSQHGSEPLLSTPDDSDGVPPTLILDWLYRCWRTATATGRAAGTHVLASMSYGSATISFTHSYARIRQCSGSAFGRTSASINANTG
jgi:hypothetical protein